MSRSTLLARGTLLKLGPSEISMWKTRREVKLSSCGNDFKLPSQLAALLNGATGACASKTEPGRSKFAPAVVIVPLKLKWRSVREDLPQVFAAKLFQGFDSHLAVDGSWAAWTAWTSCSATCDWGTRQRKRTCTPPQQGGQPCEGEATQTEDCRTKNCPGAFDLSIYKTF